MTSRSAAAIRLLVLDVDGTLTDGRLYFGPRGEELKSFHVRDGQGIKHLDAAGIEVAVISGRRSKMVAARCRELGVEHVIQGAEDKVVAFEKLRARLSIEASASACVGDDTTDVPLMKVVRMAFAVADAHRDALGAAHVVTSLPGGHGAVREVCDYILDARKQPKKKPR
jgi:3-deoxy-D-manno-octulosonate 8-phosphate phosphatase (KDO 8-P phosphatase)